ncbi:MAG: hypothetical protein IT288_15155 [Bdellovibrionales bacterium]|nr:hypothetical protein [Bdellovibrionales bacterium]
MQAETGRYNLARALGLAAWVIWSLALGGPQSFGFDMPKLTKGTGARFDMKLSTGAAEVAIIVADTSNSESAVEYYFKDLSWTGIEMWQRFHLRPEGKKMRLADGFILMPQFGQAMKLTPEYLQGFDGVQLSSFMMESSAEFNAHKVGVEKVTVPAGTVEATHYRVQQRGQTIDFWVHDSAKPVGVVKVVSSGKEIKHNYTMELRSLIQNAQPKIDPSKAGPLTKEAKEFLPKTGAGLLTQ